MRRLAVALATVLVLGVAQAGPASAGNEWCSQDPVVQVLGSQFHVTTSVNASAWAVEQIAYTFEVPANATDAVAHFSQGKRLPSTVEFDYSDTAYDGTADSFPVKVTVVVTTAASVDVEVKVFGRSVAPRIGSGLTSESISFVIDVAAR